MTRAITRTTVITCCALLVFYAFVKVCIEQGWPIWLAAFPPMTFYAWLMWKEVKDAEERE